MSRRGFLATSVAGVAGLVLGSACGPADDTLNFMHPADPTGVVQRQIDRWNRGSHPFLVQWLQAPSAKDQYFQQLRSQLQAGGGPIDVISGDVTWTAQLGANGWVEDLTALSRRAYPNGTFLPAPQEAVSWDGRVWAIPWLLDLGMLWFRTDLLAQAGVAQPPATQQELLPVAQEARARSGAKYGLVYPGAADEDGVCTADEYIWNAGGEILTPSDPTRILIGGAEAIAGLSAERLTITSGLAPPLVTTWRQQDAIASFLDGEAVFLRAWSGVLPLVGRQGTGPGRVRSRSQLSAASLPALAPSVQPASCLGGWNLYVNAASRKKQAAWAFASYLAAPAQARERTRAGLLTPRSATLGDRSLLGLAPTARLAGAIAPDARSRPVSPIYADLSLRMQAACNASLQGTSTPSAVAAQLQTDLQQLVDQGGPG
ncbi:MAG: extracellular solute-binding protein [Candidatus Dormiibacterota bacterium]